MSIFKYNTTLLSSLILASSILTFSLTKVSVNAGVGPKYSIVTHPNGVNVRDKNCKIVDQVGYGSVLDRSGTEEITCNINGENFVMINYGNGSYFSGGNTSYRDYQDKFIAIKYLKPVNTNIDGVYTTQDKVRLNNPNGVNLRDNNCQRVMTLPNNTYSENFPPNNVNYRNVCQVGNEFYYMTSFVYQNKVYSVAEILVKFE